MTVEIEKVIELIEKFIEDTPKENKPIFIKRYIEYGVEYKCPRCEEKIIQHEGHYNTGKYCCNCGLFFIWDNGKEDLIDELLNLNDNQ